MDGMTHDQGILEVTEGLGDAKDGNGPVGPLRSGRWAHKRSGSRGNASPGRAKRPTRPSWPTATSGRGDPTRRRGYTSARGRATSSRSNAGRPGATGGGGRVLGTPTCKPSATGSL